MLIQPNRRDVLRAGFGSMGLMLGGSTLWSCGSDGTDSPLESGRKISNIANLGGLAAPDQNGLRLPVGFTSRVLAVSGQSPISGQSYQWHYAPDGGATFKTDDGGWVYVSNAEVSAGGGGVGALRFAKDGTIMGAYPILTGTSRNCAGGPTPWGTWLSCEEVSNGQVFECQPLGGEAKLRAALGTFNHEAVAVDPKRSHLYLTEDEPDGRLYRFIPDNALPDLSAGTLEVMEVTGGTEGAVTWHTVPDPLAGSTPTRYQVAQGTEFAGGEGVWFHEDVVYFTTKYDNHVWALDVAQQTLWILYKPSMYAMPHLSGVDNVVVSAGGDVLVAEDGGDMQIVALTAQNTVLPILQITGQASSEVTGPAFDPSGERLYFSSQRGSDGFTGITYEVKGPFFVDG